MQSQATLFSNPGTPVNTEEKRETVEYKIIGNYIEIPFKKTGTLVRDWMREGCDSLEGRKTPQSPIQFSLQIDQMRIHPSNSEDKPAQLALSFVLNLPEEDYTNPFDRLVLTTSVVAQYNRYTNPIDNYVQLNYSQQGRIRINLSYYFHGDLPSDLRLQGVCSAKREIDLEAGFLCRSVVTWWGRRVFSSPPLKGLAAIFQVRETERLIQTIAPLQEGLTQLQNDLDRRKQALATIEAQLQTQRAKLLATSPNKLPTLPALPPKEEPVSTSDLSNKETAISTEAKKVAEVSKLLISDAPIASLRSERRR